MRIFGSVRKRIAAVTVAFGLVLALVPMLPAMAGYAPASRPTFQCITPTNCPGANYVTFNSFTNAPNYGDERAFFDAKNANITGSGGYQDQLNVYDGEQIVMRVYIHNNANPNAIGFDAATAHNTAMQVLLPTSDQTHLTAVAQISASNANPATVSDTVDMYGASPFTMAFNRSAPVQVTYRPNGQGDYVTRNLPGATFASDQTLNANFGDWHGCFNYAALVTFTVTIHMPTPPQQPVYSCDALNVSSEGNRTYNYSVDATAKNGATITGYTFDFGDGNSVNSNDNKTSHTYAKDGTYTTTATVKFNVSDSQKTASCSHEITVSTPPVTPPPTTPPTTPTPKPTSLPQTGPGDVLGIFTGVSSLGAVGHYVVNRRRRG